MEPNWYKEAKRLEDKGIVEIPGKKHNADIMYMAKKLGTWYPSDETAWCGLFVAYCQIIGGAKDKLPSNILGAKQWKNYGVEVQKDEIATGDILVFWRGSPKGAYGHVGYYAGETKDAYKVLGGNQGNSVSYAWVAKKRLISARRPKGAKAGPRVEIKTSGPINLSTNEG
jgi:uncharacterized protein (TIGR02594 family)